MTGVSGTIGVLGVVALAGVTEPGVDAPGVEAVGVEAAGVMEPGVPLGVARGVVPGVAGIITTGARLGLSPPARDSGRGVTKRASLMR